MLLSEFLWYDKRLFRIQLDRSLLHIVLSLLKKGFINIHYEKNKVSYHKINILTSITYHNGFTYDIVELIHLHKYGNTSFIHHEKLYDFRSPKIRKRDS